MKDFITRSKEFLTEGVGLFATGLCTGITLTRIIDGGNVIGAVAAGVVISFIVVIGYKVAR